MILSPNKVPFTGQGVQDMDISFWGGGGRPLGPLQLYDFFRVTWEHVQDICLDSGIKDTESRNLNLVQTP